MPALYGVTVESFCVPSVETCRWGMVLTVLVQRLGQIHSLVTQCGGSWSGRRVEFGRFVHERRDGVDDMIRTQDAAMAQA